MEEREKILLSARELFMSEGFYKSTMDELAQRLRVSKKTIYKHFNSKDEILREATLGFFSEQREAVNSIVASDINSIEKFYRIFNHISQFTLRISEKFLVEVQTFAPDLWSEIDEMRAALMTRNISRIFQQGIEEGYIREVPSVVVVNILVSAIRGISRSDFLIHNKITLSEAVQKTVEIISRGIMTPRGEAIFKKLMNKELK